MAANFIAKLNQLPKSFWVAFTFVILACVVVIDFLTGYEISCTVFYLVATGLATWFVGASFGILVSILSAIATSMISIVSGEHYSNRFAPVWDAAIVLSFYRIAQEAAHNAIRHGHARKIDIRLGKSGLVAALVICDDGSGIPNGEPIHHGMGLRNMKYRASIIGGNLTFDGGESGALNIAFPSAWIRTPPTNAFAGCSPKH